MSGGRYTERHSRGQSWNDADADRVVLDGDAHWHHLENMIEPYIVVAMRFYVKLF